MLKALTLSVMLFAALLPPAADNSFLAAYKGTPFHDSRYHGGAQRIPGKVMCAYYDLGGEGVAYHDADAANHGSGALNPADGSYLNEFRMGEGVDTSYTKFGRDPQIDDTPYDKTTPDANCSTSAGPNPASGSTSPSMWPPQATTQPICSIRRTAGALLRWT